MGTRFNTVIPNHDEELCEKFFRLSEIEVKRIEAKLSFFDKDSIVSQINREASEREVFLDEEMFEILQICLDYQRLTYGAFDITMRRLIEFYFQNPDAIETSLRSCVNSIKLNPTTKSVHYTNNETQIDFGGFGKGYALTKVKKLLDEQNIPSAFISFGESSIMTKGNHPSGHGWKVGINDYSSNSDSAFTFNLFDESLSTSSNYFIDDSGDLIFKANVIDPTTGNLKREIETVSVKSTSPLECEILSTALINLSHDKIAYLKNEFRCIEIVRINYFNSNKSVICY